MIKKNETGRSMVEMLGVLAIVGVLSVAGIRGYTVAMRKYRANEIANAISLMGATMKTTNEVIDAQHPKSYQDLLDVSSDPSGVDRLEAISDTEVVLEADSEELCDAVASLFGTNNHNPSYVDADDCDDDDHSLHIIIRN